MGLKNYLNQKKKKAYIFNLLPLLPCKIVLKPTSISNILLYNGTTQEFVFPKFNQQLAAETLSK